MSGGRRLIVNADDLGFAAARDDAILDLAARGVATAATLAVNGPTAAPAARRAAEAAPAFGLMFGESLGLPLGLHLNLSEGPALSGRSTLTDADGQLLGKFGLRERLLVPAFADQTAGAIADADLVREIRAQLDRFRALTGRLPTHLDGHHHIHVAPRVARLLAPILAREYGVYRVRMPSPEDAAALAAAFADDPATHAFQRAIDAETVLARPLYAAHGLRWPAALLGRALMGERLTAAGLRAALDRCRYADGPVELMCHPGLRSPDDNAFGQAAGRPAEHAFLASPAFAVACAGWRRIGWADLHRERCARGVRTLICGRLDPAAGDATTAATLARALAARGETIFRRLPEAAPNDPAATARVATDLRQAVAEEAVDAVFGLRLDLAGPPLAAAFGAAGAPPYLLLARGGEVDNVQKKAGPAAVRAALAGATGLVAQSAGQLRALEAGPLADALPAQRTVFDRPPELPPERPAARTLHELLGLPPGRPLAVLAGGIDPSKDVAFAIEAGAQALLEHPDHALAILGPALDADYHAYCRTLVVEWQLRQRALKGRLLLHEGLPRADYLAALPDAALVLDTSKGAGRSNALLEAMGLGVAVLARDHADNRELVRDGDTGLLFDGLPAFVAQYRRLFADRALRARLVESGRAEYALRAATATDAPLLALFDRVLANAGHGKVTRGD